MLDSPQAHGLPTTQNGATVLVGFSPAPDDSSIHSIDCTFRELHIELKTLILSRTSFDTSDLCSLDTRYIVAVVVENLALVSWADACKDAWSSVMDTAAGSSRPFELRTKVGHVK